MDGAPLHKICCPNESVGEGSVPSKIARLLLDHGADPNIKDYLEQTPLHNLCWFSKEKEICQLLLENRVNIEAQDKDGSTPLHKACEGGNVEMVELLLKRGANIAAKDKAGNTPLHTSLFESDGTVEDKIKTIKRLINDSNLDFNAINNKGKTFLDILKEVEDEEFIAEVEAIISKSAIETNTPRLR